MEQELFSVKLISSTKICHLLSVATSGGILNRVAEFIFVKTLGSYLLFCKGFKYFGLICLTPSPFIVEPKAMQMSGILARALFFTISLYHNINKFSKFNNFPDEITISFLDSIQVNEHDTRSY